MHRDRNCVRDYETQTTHDLKLRRIAGREVVVGRNPVSGSNGT